MTPPTIQLFVSPDAGVRSSARAAALQAAFEAQGARVLVTQSVADRLTVDARADHVCAVGGDGTLRHVVDAVRRAARAVPISAYPAGTVNLLAMEHDYPRDPHAFARRVLAAAEGRRQHVALVDGVPLLTCASVGPDSYAVARLSPWLKRRIGRTAYLIAFCSLLFRWRRETIVVRHDGGQAECEAVYIAKGRFFAGRWSFAPQANAGEPLLHVTLLRHASRRHFLRFAWTLLRRRPVDQLAGATCLTCTELSLGSAAAPPLQADGDIVAHLPVSITLAAEAFAFA